MAVIWTLAAAHRLATALRHQIAQSRDPGRAHQGQQNCRTAAADAAANTFAAAARDFIEGHARKKVRRWHELARFLGLRPDTLELIPKGLADRWAERPVAEIDGHDIHGVVDEARRLGVPGLTGARTEEAKRERGSYSPCLASSSAGSFNTASSRQIRARAYTAPKCQRHGTGC